MTAWQGFVDGNGVQFDLPTTTVDPEDTSRIAEVYEMGELYRWTFTMAVQGYVITDSGEDSYVPIETVKWNLWDGTGEDDRIAIKSVDVVE